MKYTIRTVQRYLHEVSPCGSQRDDISVLVRTSKEFAKLRELIEDRADERDAAELSLEDRGEGIPLKTVVKKYQ